MTDKLRQLLFTLLVPGIVGMLWAYAWADGQQNVPSYFPPLEAAKSINAWRESHQQDGVSEVDEAAFGDAMSTDSGTPAGEDAADAITSIHDQFMP